MKVIVFIRFNHKNSFIHVVVPSWKFLHIHLTFIMIQLQETSLHTVVVADEQKEIKRKQERRWFGNKNVSRRKNSITSHLNDSRAQSVCSLFFVLYVFFVCVFIFLLLKADRYWLSSPFHLPFFVVVVCAATSCY